jgi:transcription antitermination factor NusG
MPILSLEPQLFPADLFDARGAPGFVPNSDRGLSGTLHSTCPRVWSVLHTRPRQEKSLARTLYATQIPFFLPLGRRWVPVRNRMAISYNPLFAGYLFLRADPEERLAALSTSRVVQAIAVADQERLVRDLAQIHQMLGLGVPITTENRMVPGTAVEIQSGPLAGLKGKIVQEASRHRFVVEVDFIQRGASVVLDGTTLAPVRE